MVYSERTILLPFLVGAILGCVYCVIRKICVVFNRKKLLEFFLDFTFVVTAFVITFILSLAIDSGHIRAIQLIGQFAGFTIVVATLSPFLKKSKRRKDKLE